MNSVGFFLPGTGFLWYTVLGKLSKYFITTLVNYKAGLLEHFRCRSQEPGGVIRTALQRNEGKK